MHRVLIAVHVVAALTVTAQAETVNVAVAANFTDAANEIAAAFADVDEERSLKVLLYRAPAADGLAPA